MAHISAVGYSGRLHLTFYNSITTRGTLAPARPYRLIPVVAVDFFFHLSASNYLQRSAARAQRRVTRWAENDAYGGRCFARM